MRDRKPNDSEQCDQQKKAGLVKEFIVFMGENKKFWLIPLLLVLLMVGALLLSDGATAFNYTLF